MKMAAMISMSMYVIERIYTAQCVICQLAVNKLTNEGQENS